MNKDHSKIGPKVKSLVRTLVLDRISLYLGDELYCGDPDTPIVGIELYSDLIKVIDCLTDLGFELEEEKEIALRQLNKFKDQVEPKNEALRELLKLRNE